MKKNWVTGECVFQALEAYIVLPHMFDIGCFLTKQSFNLTLAVLDYLIFHMLLISMPIFLTTFHFKAQIAFILFSLLYMYMCPIHQMFDILTTVTEDN